MRVSHAHLHVCFAVALTIALVLGLTRTTFAVDYFAAGVNYAAGESAQDIIAGDFNNDGYSDLATANYDTNALGISLNLGDGTFDDPILIGVGADTTVGLSTGDFNEDDNLDIVTANNNGVTKGISILTGNGDGTFTLLPHVSEGVSSSVFAAAVGDLDGDDNSDIVAACYSTTKLCIFYGNGDGTFDPVVHMSTTGRPNEVHVADLDNDTDTDILVGTESNISVFLNLGGGTFDTETLYTDPGYTWSVSLTDWNDDGFTDVAASNNSNKVNILLNDQDGTFTTGASLTVPAYPNKIISEDFDADGLDDLAVAVGSGSNFFLRIYLSGGDGTFSAPMDFATTGGAPSAVAVADFNNDGKIDAATSNNDTAAVGITVFLNIYAPEPIVTAGAIAVTGDSAGIFKIGDTVTVSWNNTVGGDNNDSISGVTADLSDWGGGAAATMTDTTACGGTAGDDVYEACYTLVEGAIETASAEASVTVTNGAGDTTTADGTTYTVDTLAPVISAVEAQAGATEVTITWTTDVLASSAVSYGLTDSYDSSTDESDTSPRVMSHTVTLSELARCTTYHYVPVSKDVAGNTSSATGVTFRTTACRIIPNQSIVPSVPSVPSEQTGTSASETNSQAPASFTTPVKHTILTGQLARTLRPGMTGVDVRILQQFLNASGYVLALTGPGSPGNETERFGRLTREALIRFQNDHKDVLLAPLGLEYGTGVLGSLTRDFILTQ